jgi:hypothetical protein
LPRGETECGFGRRVRVHSAGALCRCRAPGARRAGIKKGPGIKKVVWNPVKTVKIMIDVLTRG